MTKILIIIGAYLIGNILTGWVLAKFIYRRDIHHEGSGNVGARNAGRLYGKTAFIITLLGDAGKGMLLVSIGKWLEYSPSFQLLLLLVVIIGHIYPLMFRFKGGKGIATFIGGIAIFDPPQFAVFACVFILFFIIFRSLTLSGMLAITLFPLLMVFYSYTSQDIIVATCISLVLLYAHRQNLKEKIIGERNIS